MRAKPQSSRTTPAAPLRRVTIADLTIDDEDAYKHIALFGDLKTILRRSRYAFAVPGPEGLTASEALLLNLVYWTDGDAHDVLESTTIPADVVMHVGWHHVANHFLPGCARAEILGEAIASAFDLYLVGRLLGHSGEAEFLESQVPRMADAAAEAGMSDEAFEQMLAATTESPEAAFEGLRATIYETTCALANAGTTEDALAILRAARDRPYGALLHHFELSTWVLKARGRLSADGAAGEEVERLHATLKSEPVAMDWLSVNWVVPYVEGLPA